jgi:N-acetyltransferase
MNVQPVSLSGRFVRLEPLSHLHVPDLFVAGQDAAVWRYLPYGPMPTMADMHAWVDSMLALQAAGSDVPFGVVHLQSGRAIGCTRYMDIQRPHRGLEIGGTWYAPAHQRTAVNTECKLLLLEHAFERLGCVRVQLKTDLRNQRSQQAIERLGAMREGVLRRNMILPDGYIRDTVYYSILDSEWPAVKARLVERLYVSV